MDSPEISLLEKLEFLYFAPYYLQSVILLVGTVCWVLAIMLDNGLPFWTESLGWCLVIINLLALPMMNLSGLYLEGSVSEDFKGLLGFIVLNYLLAPFQAYASVKGLVEAKEGFWFRTPKTGRITDNLLYVHLRRIVGWVSPNRERFRKKLDPAFNRVGTLLILLLLLVASLYLILHLSDDARFFKGICNKS